jgi:hypothetical protein
VITEWFINLGGGVVTWFLSLLPGSSTLPDGVIQAGDGLSSFGALVGSMAVWVNWGALFAAVTFALSWWVAMSVVRIFRAVIGHIPLVGGNG